MSVTNHQQQQQHNAAVMAEEPDTAHVFRYGIVGCGRIGVVHSQILLAQGQHIVAVADEVPAAIDAYFEAIPELGPKKSVSVPRFQTAEAMAAAFGDQQLDAVVVASHTHFHARDATPFIRRGVKVYLEKPLTGNLDDAFDFVKAFGTENRRLMQIGLQRRFDPALLHAKALIDGGKIGRVREIRSTLRDQYPPPDTYKSPSLLVDMAVHVSDEVAFLLDDSAAITKLWATKHEAAEYDSVVKEGGNTAFVTFECAKSGVIGRLEASRTFSAGYNNECLIIGTHGVIHCGRFCGYPGPIPVELWRPNGTLDAEHSKTFQMPPLVRPFAEFLPRFLDALRTAHREFRRVCAAGKEDFRVTQREVLDAQIVVEAAHMSACRDGAAVEIRRSADLDEYYALCKTAGFCDRAKEVM